MTEGRRPPRSTRRPERPRPRGRGRPPVISSEALLEVARQVFLEKGIRATTADVAERAGVSEGTIFHRFRSKDELFRAAMRFDPADLPALFAELEGMVGKGDLRENLVGLAMRMLELGRVAIPIMMMSWSNPEDELSLEKISAKSEAYRRAGSMIRTFFEREIEAGRIAAADPTVLARVFLGSLHHFAMSQLLVLADKGPLAIPPEAFVQGLVDLIVRAAVPAPAHHRTKLERL